jgi:cytosine/uracil/thiamine/allantoin permease
MSHQTTMSHVHHGLPLGLAAGAGVLLLFGVSWWTTFIAILLVACPAAIAVAMRVCFCKISGLPEPRLDARRHNRAIAPGAGRDIGGPHAAP